MPRFSLKKKAQKLTTWITLVLFTLQPSFIAAQTVADPNAAKQNRPTVESAQNGTPVVQIAAPTANGVSHNLYQQFNIDPQGLILNNSYALSKTQLAGYIQGNPNLAGGSARVILNEVTSTNISHLRGYLEVAGQRADVIIANRNGIIGNGFGFINTNRGVLTTGTPIFGGNGSLEAFRVTGGQIAVQGDGINATGADRVDLISRAVTVNAGIWAKDLNVVTGSNAVDYNTLTTQTIASDSTEPQPQVAIDVSALGGMYANKIKLVGTEQGVGVNSQGTLSADSGNLILTNNGQITLAGKTSAGGSININATDDINAQGTIFAKQSTSVTSNGTLTNTGTMAAGNNTDLTAKAIASNGTIAAGIKTDGTIGTAGNLTVTATETLAATGKTIAGGNLTLTGTNIDVSGATSYAGGSASITATNGDIDHSGATTQVNGQLTLTATGAVKNLKNTNNVAGQITAGKIAITAGEILNQGGTIQQTGSGDITLTATGTIDNTAGTIATNGSDFTLTAANIVNDQGKIEHAGSGTLTVQTTQDFINSNGNLASNGQVGVHARQVNNTQGTILSQKQLNVNAEMITNTKGNLVSGEALALTSQGSINNQQGLIQSDKGLHLKAQSLNNQSGNVLNLTTGEIKIEAIQAISNSAGRIGSNSNVAIKTQTLTNAGEITALGELAVTTSQNLDNTDGKMYANQGMMLNTGTSGINNTRGTVTTGDSLSLSAETVDNTSGMMSAYTDVNLTAKRLEGNEGKVTAGRDVTFVSTGDFTQGTGSQVKANGNVSVDVTGTVTNQGGITAMGDTTFKATKITNGTTGTVAAKNTLTFSATNEVNNSGRMDGNTVKVDSKAVTNAGTVTAGSLTVNADTMTNFGETAMLASTSGTVFNVKDKLENKDGATIYSTGNILIAGSDKRDASGQSLDKANSVMNQSATIEADGNIAIYAKDITNKKRVYEVGQTVVSDVTYTKPVARRVWVRHVQAGGGDETCSSYYDEEFRTNLFDPEAAILFSVKRVKSKIFNREYDLKTWMLGQTVTETKFTQDSPESKITAGGNITLRSDTVNNNNSIVMAAGKLDSSGILNNISQGRLKTTTRHLAEGGGAYNAVEEDTERENSKIFYGDYRSYDETTYEQLPGTTAIFSGGKQVTITGPSVNNITKNPENITGGNTSNIIPLKKTDESSAKTVLGTGKAITLPNNKLYTISTNPSSHYLVETDPRFTNYGTFVTSDYMLGKLNLDPAKTMKQIGDGFYQQKLIREQLIELTGRQFLNNSSSTQEEYKALMDSGATYAKQFNLQIGVALTPEQMAKLTSNMVWLVEQEVQGQKVLVPVVYLAPNQTSSLRNNGAIISGENVSITADQDIVNQNSKITGGDITLVAGRDIKNETTTFVAKAGVHFESGNDIRTMAGQTAEITATGNLTVNAKQDVKINGGKLTAGNNVTIDTGRNLEIGTVATGDKTTRKNYFNETTTNITSSITAGDNITVKSKQDTNLTGAKLTAGKNVTLTSTEGNININTVKDEEILDTKSSGWFRTNSYHKETTSNVISSITAGENIGMSSKQDTNLSGADLNASKELNITANGNVNITAVKNEILQDEKTGSSSNWKRTRTDDETVIGSNLHAGGNVNIATVQSNDNKEPNKGNITIAGSNVTSDNGKIAIKADKDVTIQEVKEKHESLVQTHKKKSGFFSSKTTDTLDYSLTNQVKGSTISGDQVDINSGNNLTVKAGTVVATNDVKLQADNDVTLTSAQETGKEEHYKRVKKSGLFGGGGLGFTIGSQSTTTTLNEQVKDEIGTTVGSINGNVTVTSGNKVKSEGTTFVSGKDTNISGKEVTIDNTINTYDSQYKLEYKKSGLTVSLGGTVIESGLSMANHLDRSGEVEDNRLQALHLKKTYEDYRKIDKTFDELGKLKDDLNKAIEKGKITNSKVDQDAATKAGNSLKDSIDKAFSINVSLGTAKTTMEQNTHVETVNASNVSAGGNVTIKSTAGDVNLKATNINATNITIDAVKDLNIESAKNVSTTDTKTNSSSASVGATIGLGSGSFTGFNAGVNSTKGKENQASVTNTESVVNASGTVSLKSGDDTNIIGSQVKGNKVEVTVGDNLNIESKQDSETYKSETKSKGINATTGFKPSKDDLTKKVGTSNVTGSTNTEKINSNYTSVAEQAGIFAGKDGFDIKVGKNTGLKGGVISSDATPDKNKISTDTLTWHDLHNKAKYEASSKGANYDSKKYSPLDKDYKNQGLIPNIGITASGSDDSTTYSAISPGTIEIRSNPNQDISTLSRDTTNSLNALGKIFDKKTVEERQELAQMLGEEAFKAIGDLGLKTGSVEKTVVTATVGGIMAKLGGSSFTSGAAGAGITEIAMKEISKINDPAVRQWVTYVVGKAAASMVGGDGQTGGSVSVSKIRNNDLDPAHVKQYIASYCKDSIKSSIYRMIENGLMPASDDMTHDYHFVLGGVSLPFKFVSGSFGYVVDKKGNVYGLLEADGGFGASTFTTATVGFGDFKAPKNSSKEYIDAIEGWSFGGGGASIVQVTASVSPSGVVSREVSGTTAAGVTLLSGRRAWYLFNLKND